MLNEVNLCMRVRGIMSITMMRIVAASILVLTVRSLNEAIQIKTVKK